MAQVFQVPNAGRDKVNRSIGYVEKCIEIAEKKEDYKEVKRLQKMAEDMKLISYCPVCGETLYKFSEEDTKKYNLNIFPLYQCDDKRCKSVGNFYKEEDSAMERISGLYSFWNNDSTKVTFIYPDGSKNTFDRF